MNNNVVCKRNFERMDAINRQFLHDIQTCFSHFESLLVFFFLQEAADVSSSAVYKPQATNYTHEKSSSVSPTES